MKSASEIKNIPSSQKILSEQTLKTFTIKTYQNKYCLHSTSGSTGEKLNFYLPYELMNKKNTALIYRFYSMAGVKPLEKRVTIGGKLFTNRPPYWSYNWFENQLIISSHHINKKLYVVDKKNV